MNIIILGDKFQKRMKSKGCVGLLKTSNHQTILQNQLGIINTVFDNPTIAYVYGFDNKKFLSFISKHDHLLKNVNLIYNSEYDQYNYAHSLYLAKDYLDSDCLILFGDSNLSVRLFNKFDTSDGTQIFINKHTKNKLGCIINNKIIENISYDLDNYLYDIYYLSKDHASYMKTVLETNIVHNYFIFELINKLTVSNNCIVKPFNINLKPTTYQRI